MISWGYTISKEQIADCQKFFVETEMGSRSKRDVTFVLYADRYHSGHGCRHDAEKCYTETKLAS